MLVTTRERHDDAVVRVPGVVGRNAHTVLLAVADQLQVWPGCSFARWGVVPRGPSGKVVWAVLGPAEARAPSLAERASSGGAA